MFIRDLPMGSSFVAEVRGGQQFRGWDPDRYMTARMIDVLRVHTYLFVTSNIDRKKHKLPAPPVPYPVPDKTVKSKQPDKPGSFAFISKSMLAEAKKRKAAG
jgi:hypothetical protein